MNSYSSGIDSVLDNLRGTYREISRVSRDVSICLNMFQGLLPIDEDVDIGGYRKHLLALVGTIPVEFRGQVYDFPIEIVIPETYPFKAPIFRVKPFGNLRIVSGHRHVDDQGLVHHQYLSSWSPGNSSVGELVVQVAEEFSFAPPLYSPAPGSGGGGSFKTPPPPPVPPPPISASSAVRRNGSGVPPPPYSQSTPVPPPPYQQRPLSSVPPPPISSSSSSLQPTAAVYRSKVIDKLKMRCNTTFPNLQNDLQMQLDTSEKLEANGGEIANRLRNLKTLEIDMKNQFETLQRKALILQQAIIEQNEKQDAMQTNLDNLIQPADATSKQLFQCVSESLAIDDALYQLNAAFNRQHIDLKTFLKQARSLSRDQFYNLALAIKINETQSRDLPISGPPPPPRTNRPGLKTSYPSVPSPFHQ